MNPSASIVSFIVPTYNEAENVTALLRQLLGLFATVPWQGRVVVVDDESPDGTGELVRQIAAQDERVTLLSGAKRGLGDAYTRGFNYVLAQRQADVIVQMDADFSHAPSDAPRLVDALLRDDLLDVVIGSRYVEGGSTDAGWGRLRRIISRAGNLFARYVAGIKGVRDCTAGFRAIRVSALRQAFPLRFAVQGYVFQVALLHALMITGAQVAERPIRFLDRSAGETKLGRRDVAEFFIHVWWLRLLSRKTFVKFIITGATGVVVNLGSFQMLLSNGLDPYLSSAVAIELSIVWNFFVNNYWTFRDRTMTSRKRVRGLKFNLVSLLTLTVSFLTFVAVRYLLPDRPEILAQALGIIPASLANYFANSYWTFKADDQVSQATTATSTK